MLLVLQQTDLLAVYSASQPSLKESQLYLSAAQYVTFDPKLYNNYVVVFLNGPRVKNLTASHGTSHECCSATHEANLARHVEHFLNLF